MWTPDAEELVRAAERLWLAGRASEAAERLAAAERQDRAHPDIYRLRALMARAAGREELELQAWKGLVELSRASLPLRRSAKQRIAELYRLLDGNRPEWEYRLPPPPPPGADIDVLKGNVWRVYLKPPAPEDRRQVGELRFTVPRERSGWWIQGCLDSRGLVLSASLERRVGARWQPLWSIPASQPQRFPQWQSQLEAGEYRLRVEHDAARDGVEGAFHIALSLVLRQEKPLPPTSQWTYRLHPDGSAEVEVLVSGTLALPVPFTAEGVQVAGARYSLLPPVCEYLSKTEQCFAQVMLLQSGDGQTTVRFRWLDAAWNVPGSPSAPHDAERMHFRSLPLLGAASGETPVVVHLPEGTEEVVRLTPEPRSREGNILRFLVPPGQTVTLQARHAQMNTRWLTATYRRLTVYLPDTPFYRRWLPEYLARLMRLYDQQRRATGAQEPEEIRWWAVPWAVPLVAGGPVGGRGSPLEVWVSCPERVNPCRMRYAREADSVEEQRLREAFRTGTPH